MYNVWRQYGSDEYGYDVDVIAAFNIREKADKYAAEHNGWVVYDPKCAGYPEFVQA